MNSGSKINEAKANNGAWRARARVLVVILAGCGGVGDNALPGEVASPFSRVSSPVSPAGALSGVTTATDRRAQTAEGLLRLVARELAPKYAVTAASYSRRR